MGFSSLIKQVVDKAKESGAITPDPATTAIPNPTSSVAAKEQAPASKSGAITPDPATTAISNPTPSVAAKEQAPASNVGDFYKRLTAADIEEEEKKKGMKKGGVVKSSASKRGDGCAIRGKTRGRMV